jgi:hypothetical protein
VDINKLAMDVEHSILSCTFNVVFPRYRLSIDNYTSALVIPATQIYRQIIERSIPFDKFDPNHEIEAND